MAIQKKSLVGKQKSAKKALVAKRVATNAPKAEEMKAPFRLHRIENAFRFGHSGLK